MKHKALWTICLVLAPACLAQSPQTRPALTDGGVSEKLISIFIPNTSNAPFTATVNTEWVRVLPDNSRITLVNHRLIARDSAGRVFQERRLLVPQNGHQESVVTQTEIMDPILKQQYICRPRANTCQVEFRQPMFAAVQPPHAIQTPRGSSPMEPGIQALGTRTIGGVETVGTRETVVIPAGEIGNDSPINTSREFWFSPQLGLNVVSVRDDPRFGTQRFEVSDIVLGEPDTTLFSPPEGSRIIDFRNPPESKAPQPQN
jgi:hypothetical protein